MASCWPQVVDWVMSPAPQGFAVNTISRKLSLLPSLALCIPHCSQHFVLTTMTKSSYGSFKSEGTEPLISSSQTEVDPEEQSDSKIVGAILQKDPNEDDRMSPIQAASQPPLQFNLNTRFAADRTYLAADRTAIAWVRTAMSMIGFGVTLAKGADFLESQGIVDNGRTLYIFGVLFVATAWVGLLMVIVQNIQLERRISSTGYDREESGPLGLMMAIFMLIVCGSGIAFVLRDRFGF